MSEKAKQDPTPEQCQAALVEAYETVTALTAELACVHAELAKSQSNFGMAVLTLWHLAMKEKSQQIAVTVDPTKVRPVFIDFNDQTNVYTITALTEEDVEARKKNLN